LCDDRIGYRQKLLLVGWCQFADIKNSRPKNACHGVHGGFLIVISNHSTIRARDPTAKSPLGQRSQHVKHALIQNFGVWTVVVTQTAFGFLTCRVIVVVFIVTIDHLATLCRLFHLRSLHRVRFRFTHRGAPSWYRVNLPDDMPGHRGRPSRCCGGAIEWLNSNLQLRCPKCRITRCIDHRL